MFLRLEAQNNLKKKKKILWWLRVNVLIWKDLPLEMHIWRTQVKQKFNPSSKNLFLSRKNDTGIWNESWFKKFLTAFFLKIKKKCIKTDPFCNNVLDLMKILLAALLRSRTEIIWNSRKPEEHLRTGNCHLGGHSANTEDAAICTYNYPRPIWIRRSSDLPSDSQKIFKTPTTEQLTAT